MLLDVSRCCQFNRGRCSLGDGTCSPVWSHLVCAVSLVATIPNVFHLFSCLHFYAGHPLVFCRDSGFLLFYIGFLVTSLFISLITVVACRLSVMCCSIRDRFWLRSALCVCLPCFRARRVSSDSLIFMCSTTCTYVGRQFHGFRPNGFVLSV